MEECELYNQHCVLDDCQSCKDFMKRNQYEKTCCWCRKVIKPGTEMEHIHYIELKVLELKGGKDD